jgi:nitronate monooxygenase
MKNSILHSLQIERPIIMAPMFLVSNESMMKAGIEAGIMSIFPSLNFRKEGELKQIIQSLSDYKKDKTGNFGVNLIVQQSNPLYKKHLRICIEEKVPFFITSLGNPKEVIELAHQYGGKVFCDVTNIEHAQKCFDVGCDGFIAVGQGAGGHAGPNPLHILIPSLKAKFPNTPIIGAGGITDGQGLLSIMTLGAEAASIGTRFIASEECQVNMAYKEAIVNSNMDDIVMTTKLSGTPCTIIDTPAAKKMGYEQNWFEKWLSRSKRTKKWFKMLIQIRGMKQLEKSILPNNYDTLWCAGKSVEMITNILPCKKIIEDIISDFNLNLEKVKQLETLK